MEREQEKSKEAAQLSFNEIYQILGLNQASPYILTLKCLHLRTYLPF